MKSPLLAGVAGPTGLTLAEAVIYGHRVAATDQNVPLGEAAGRSIRIPEGLAEGALQRPVRSWRKHVFGEGT
jgi:hypothetical protein